MVLSKTWQTWIVLPELQISRLGSGKVSTEMFVRYQRSEKALMLSLLEMVIHF